MGRSTFQGPIRSLGGIFQQGPATVVNVTSSTTLNPVDHGGRIISVGGTLASDLTLTLPVIDATANPTTSGPGQDPNTLNNLGVVYTIWVPTTIATSELKIRTSAAGSDIYIGTLLSVDTDSSDAMRGFTANGTSNDFINLNGGTKGGRAGTWVQIVAIAATKYVVTGVILGSGIVATPFADS